MPYILQSNKDARLSGAGKGRGYAVKHVSELAGAEIWPNMAK